MKLHERSQGLIGVIVDRLGVVGSVTIPNDSGKTGGGVWGRGWSEFVLFPLLLRKDGAPGAS